MHVFLLYVIFFISLPLFVFLLIYLFLSFLLVTAPLNRVTWNHGAIQMLLLLLLLLLCWLLPKSCVIFTVVGCSALP